MRNNKNLKFEWKTDDLDNVPLELVLRVEKDIIRAATVAYHNEKIHQGLLVNSYDYQGNRVVFTSDWEYTFPTWEISEISYDTSSTN